ncbi:MAG TPA: hypothetical protein V6D23_11220 [Candidatus Obscuribacterales bacterium]
MPLKQLLAFGGMILSGLCFVYGMALFWMGLLRLAMPQIFSKPGHDPVIQFMLIAAGIILLAIGWLLGKNMQEMLKDSEQ